MLPVRSSDVHPCRLQLPTTRASADRKAEREAKKVDEPQLQKKIHNIK